MIDHLTVIPENHETKNNTENESDDEKVDFE